MTDITLRFFALVVCAWVGVMAVRDGVRHARRAELRRACERDLSNCPAFERLLTQSCAKPEGARDCWLLSITLRRSDTLSRRTLAASYAQRACDLGVSEACGDLETKDPDAPPPPLDLLVRQRCGGDVNLVVHPGQGAVIDSSVGNVYLGGTGATLALVGHSEVRCVVCGGGYSQIVANGRPAPQLVASAIGSTCDVRYEKDPQGVVAALSKRTPDPDAPLPEPTPSPPHLNPTNLFRKACALDKRDPLPQASPACDNLRLMEEAGRTGKRLRVCPYDDPDQTCLHESPPPQLNPRPRESW